MILTASMQTQESGEGGRDVPEQLLITASTVFTTSIKNNKYKETPGEYLHVRVCMDIQGKRWKRWINMLICQKRPRFLQLVGGREGVGGTYLTGVDLKNPYQSNPVIDSSRQEVQRSRGRKKDGVCEYRTICPSPRAPQIAQLTDDTWTLATLLQSSDPTKRFKTDRQIILTVRRTSRKGWNKVAESDIAPCDIASVLTSTCFSEKVWKCSLDLTHSSRTLGNQLLPRPLHPDWSLSHVAPPPH